MSRLTLMATLAAAVIAPLCAEAGERLALVIGNANYERVADLPNPVAEAEAVSDKLRTLGFKVTLAKDLTGGGLEHALLALRAARKSDDTLLIYVFGHGVSVNGANYVVPTDARMDSMDSLAKTVVSVDDIVLETAIKTAPNLYFFDIGHDNPFETSLNRGMTFVDKGGTDEGSLVVFSTSRGRYAQEGRGPLGPFATAFLRHVGTPGMEVNALVKKITEDVSKETQGEQRPFWTSDLTADFRFVEQH